MEVGGNPECKQWATLVNVALSQHKRASGQTMRDDGNWSLHIITNITNNTNQNNNNNNLTTTNNNNNTNNNTNTNNTCNIR